MKRRAFITGIAGQDGSYLADHLLEQGYNVYGLLKYSTTEKEHINIQHLVGEIELIEGDITDRALLDKELSRIKPHEVYNLASQSHVGMSFKLPELTARVTGFAVLGILEAIRNSGFNSKFYQASTSELFGNVVDASVTKQNEKTPFRPASPYGCAKQFAHSIAVNYRESYNMFVTCGILFNHESPRRSEQFVTRKIARGAALIKHNKLDKLGLGNMNTSRDWGHAKDYVRGMHMMMQHTEPTDFVLATGQTHTIHEFAKHAFEHVGLDYREYTYVDPRFYRPVDVNMLLGDSSKAKKLLGWKPEISFKDLVEDMVEHELRLAQL